MPTEINGTSNEESSQSLIADLNALFSKQRENGLNQENDAKSYNKTLAQSATLSGIYKQILSAKIEDLKQNRILPPYNQALFEQALAKASEIVPENGMIHPMKFKSIYCELLSTFDQVPGLTESRDKVEAFLIVHNLTVEMTEDNKNKLLGAHDSNHYLKMIPDNFENPKQAFKVLTNVILTIDDEVSQLTNLQEKMRGSNDDVKNEINRLLSDADSKFTTFDQPITERITELTVLRDNLMIVKQQTADNMAFRSDQSIVISKTELPLPEPTTPMPNVTQSEIRPSMKGLN